MNREEAEIRAKKLREEIDDLRYRYHVLDDPRVTDDIYDSLMHELREIEEAFPDLKTPDSPTQRVGGKPLDAFRKVRHKIPMLSFNDAFSQDEVREWESRLKKRAPNTQWEYMCELKLDGLATSLIYVDGKLTCGSTRGDGQVGEDITENLKTIRAIPLQLNIALKHTELFPKPLVERLRRALKKVRRIEVRGEAVMPKRAFQQLNTERKRQGLTPFANPRNAAAGSLRQLDPKVAAERSLDWYAYTLVTDLGQKTHYEGHLLCAMLGFQIHPEMEVVKDLVGVFSFFERIKAKRATLPFEIDGVVVQINENEIFERMGIVGKAPRGAIAYKFSAKEATTEVLNITVQVGRTGILTPVAELKPVKVGGVVITHATLHNMEEIKRLGVQIGDTVVVQRAGDVIPKITQVIKKLRTGREKAFHMPRRCPVCGSRVERKMISAGGEKGAAYVCTNRACYAQQLRRIQHFASKAAFDIEGLGPKIVKKFIDAGLITDPADLFHLRAGDIAVLEGFAEKSAQNIYESIQKRKTIPLNRFIYALGIPHVGEETAADLARYFGSLDRLQEASREELISLGDIGEIIAESIVEFFQDKKHRRLISCLLEAGVQIEGGTTPVKRTALTGKKVAITGTLRTLTREQAKEKIREAGGDWVSSVSKNTDYVVVGENPGSKYVKAKKLGITLLSEQDFLQLLR